MGAIGRKVINHHILIQMIVFIKCSNKSELNVFMGIKSFCIIKALPSHYHTVKKLSVSLDSPRNHILTMDLVA